MPDQKQVLFIFNPSANGGKAARKEKMLRSTIELNWPNADWVKTQSGDQFWVTLEKRLDNIDLLVACGGDGTVHKAGNLAADTGCTLGVIPIGSGNDFAKMNNIPESIQSAVELLKRNQEKEIDLIRCTGDINCWCLNTIGFGLDGLANHYTNVYKQFLGKSGYLPGALNAALISKPKKLNLIIDDKIEKTESLLMLTACNGFREGGRFIVAPDAIIDDGKMNLLKVLPMNKISLLIALPKFINRFPEHLKLIESATCKNLVLKSDESLMLHVDGEYTSKTIQNIRLETISAALKILV